MHFRRFDDIIIGIISAAGVGDGCLVQSFTEMSGDFDLINAAKPPRENVKADPRFDAAFRALCA